MFYGEWRTSQLIQTYHKKTRKEIASNKQCTRPYGVSFDTLDTRSVSRTEGSLESWRTRVTCWTTGRANFDTVMIPKIGRDRYPALCQSRQLKTPILKQSHMWLGFLSCCWLLTKKRPTRTSSTTLQVINSTSESSPYVNLASLRVTAWGCCYTSRKLGSQTKKTKTKKR